VVLQGFERRLERLVEGAFGRAFPSGVQPVEIGRRIAREIDDGRQLGPRGAVAPNHFEVSLAPDDEERFASFRDALATELTDAAREHARATGCHFVGPVTVALLADGQYHRGAFEVRARIEQGATPLDAVLVAADGRRVKLAEGVNMIGRLPDCAVPLSDPQSSRHHAELRRAADGVTLVDLGSTNGTYVNGVRVHDQDLRDGDTIRVGNTTLRFEER
jgi:hypothetical protein